MKKLKKLFAVMLSLIMVLAMGITSFAATNSATITVSGLDADATVTYKQIIRPNTQTATGWEFVDKTDIPKFGKYTEDDEQAVIWKLIKMESGSATNMPANTVAFTTSEYQDALKKIATSDLPSDATYNKIAGTCEWNVSSAGVYVINANSTGKYSYNAMAAYISFGSYDTTTGAPATLENASVTAKSTTVDITKTDDEDDKVVEVGKTVTYNVTTKMPYVSANDTITQYKLIDTIDGAEYVTEADGANAGKVHVTGTVGTTAIDQYVAVVKNKNGKDTITVDLTRYLANNAHANQAVAITYQATVTSLEVNNTVIPNDGKHNFTPAEDRLYTGTVTLTKTGENNATLADAKFALKKTLADGTEKYAKVESAGDGTYKVTDWTTEELGKADTNLMTTISNGTITVKGLDDSTDYVTYEFVEVVAPNGYSINETNASVTWATGDVDGAKAASRTGSAAMTDTKLSALPATGGIGTTIFTIVGCGIMIAAAGLFFASRRKENR